MTDTSDLVERLKQPVRITHFYSGCTDEHFDPLRAEAATALTAKDKEIEALRGLRDRLLERLKAAEKFCDESEARAETAERRVAELEKTADKFLQEIAAQARLRGETERKLDEANAIAVSLRRERDEARAALKTFLKAYGSQESSTKSLDDAANAARAVIKQGE